MEQNQQQYRPGKKDDLPADEPIEQVQAQANIQSVDEVLDDIDSVLESNAEEFMRNFVQKGGQ